MVDSCLRREGNNSLVAIPFALTCRADHFVSYGARAVASDEGHERLGTKIRDSNLINLALRLLESLDSLESRLTARLKVLAGSLIDCRVQA